MTVGIFVALAVISAASFYSGNPIVCKDGDAYAEQLCWLHGASNFYSKALTLEIPLFARMEMLTQNNFVGYTEPVISIAKPQMHAFQIQTTKAQIQAQNIMFGYQWCYF